MQQISKSNCPPIPIIFFGTHTFAAAILKVLLNDSSIKVELVITQPDRPVGRNQKIKAGAVKALAIKHDIRIEQPQSLTNFQIFKFSNFQLGIAAQYGNLIPKDILSAPELGILNVHTSLLPKYRGASPIQSAIMSGETETGVTVMKMDEGLDTGQIFLQKKISIKADETYPELEVRLAKLGAEALLEVIPKYISGKLSPQPQDKSQATFCKQLTRDDGKINWQRSASEIYNQYRGLTPWPGVWTMWASKRMKLLRVRPILGMTNVGLPKAGQVRVINNKIIVQTGNGQIEILELQVEGKRAMDARLFLQGYAGIVGARFAV